MPLPFDDLFQDFPGVPQACKGFPIQDGALNQLVQSVLQGPEGTQQVSAVHGGHVAGFERDQGLNIVPVQQMALIALQFADRLHGMRQLFDDLIHRQIPEIMCGERAEHPEADVGWTGTHRQSVLRGDLVVVGWKPRRLLTDKLREIAPGSSCNLPQEPQIPFRQQELLLLRLRSKVQEPADQGG